jgi:TIR domain
MPKEVFLSHSDLDRRFATSIVRALNRNGVPVWYSRRSIIGAEQWHDEIGAALARCDWFAVILSPNSVESVWVKHELVYALNHNRYKNRIVPLLYRDCDYESLSWTLSASQMIDFRGSFASGARELMRVWGLGYRTR